MSRAILALVPLCLIFQGCGASPPHEARPEPKDSGPAWQVLFDGHDLDHWTPVRTAHWRVDNGDILGTQDGDPSLAGLLTTRDQFKNFELVLDFNIDEHGKYNSGVYLRNEPGADHQTGYQVNIGRGVVGEYCGGLYRNGWLSKGDVNDAIRRPNAWNTLHIIANGPHILVDLNGAAGCGLHRSESRAEVAGGGRHFASNVWGGRPCGLGAISQREDPHVAGRRECRGGTIKAHGRSVARSGRGSPLPLPERRVA